jgi:hypothetical protein
MHAQLIFLIALGLTMLAACFAGLFWKLVSRFDARHCTAEWLESFSLDSYAPMERLLDQSDVRFLASQVGYREEIAKRLMAERRKIYRVYIRHLLRDYNQLAGIGKLMIVYSTQDRQEFARQLWRQQIRFYGAVCSVRVQLALSPLGWTVADGRRLVAALAAMRNQVAMLAPSSQAQLEIT